MSGHSKWNNIKRKKEKTDAQKAKIFTKIGREISVAVREGGSDPSSNYKLKELIAKAKSNNVPNENIERTIKKAGTDARDSYENMVYEGYGPSGVAVIVECLTDNKNRTAADLRHYFDKFGGNLGTTGCVSFLFARKGVVIADTSGKDEEAVMEDCFEAGAVDFDIQEEVTEIFCDSADISAIRDALSAKGYEILSAEVEQIPSTYVRLDEEEHIKKMQLLLEHLEDNDDVQNVWHNLENDIEE